MYVTIIRGFLRRLRIKGDARMAHLNLFVFQDTTLHDFRCSKFIPSMDQVNFTAIFCQKG